MGSWHSAARSRAVMKKKTSTIKGVRSVNSMSFLSLVQHRTRVLKSSTYTDKNLCAFLVSSSKMSSNSSLDDMPSDRVACVQEEPHLDGRPGTLTMPAKINTVTNRK